MENLIKEMPVKELNDFENYINYRKLDYKIYITDILNLVFTFYNG